jgi:hypothetical protein
MATREAELAPSAWEEEEVLSLLAELRSAGFTLGVAEYLKVQEAMTASRGAGSEVDPLRLRNYLAPVVCKSAEEQGVATRSATSFSVLRRWV